MISSGKEQVGYHRLSRDAEGGWSSRGSAGGRNLFLLGDFLRDQIRSLNCIQEYREWYAEAELEDCLSGNLVAVERCEEGVVMMPEWADDPKLILTGPQFVGAMYDWLAAVKDRPQFVTIFLIDDRIVIKGYNSECKLENL